MSDFWPGLGVTCVLLKLFGDQIYFGVAFLDTVQSWPWLVVLAPFGVVLVLALIKLAGTVAASVLEDL